MTKTSGDVIILHMCTKNHDHMMYASGDMECDRHIFCHFAPFWTRKLKLGKNVETPGDIILLHMCTINEDHMIYGY